MAFCCGCCFKILGVITLGYILYLLALLIRQLTRPQKNVNDFGKWSIVTGSTDGIGKEIAIELAKKGQNVLLIGRNVEKLESVKNEIQSKYSKQAEILQLDLSKYDSNSEKRFMEAIANKDIGILVNNAGVAYNYTQYFDEVDQQRVQDMMAVNSTTPTLLMHRVIKDKFLKKTQPIKGAIINISSAGSIVPHELHSVYSGTKAYLNKISQDLALEYQPRGIEIQVQLPYFVVTNMSKAKKATLTTPSAQTFAKHAVRQFGYSDLIFPYPIHAIMFFIIHFIPTIILEKVIGSMHHDIRKRGMKKYGAKKD